jgi:hypothetical protein
LVARFVQRRGRSAEGKRGKKRQYANLRTTEKKKHRKQTEHGDIDNDNGAESQGLRTILWKMFGDGR